MRILGVDPGSLRTGFGVIELSRGNAIHIASGAIRLENDGPLSERLKNLSIDLEAIIQKHKPKALAIEHVFFSKNAQSALKLGQARGVILMTAARHGLEIHEYTPTEIKAAIGGSGRAQKDAVARMVRLLLKLSASFQFVCSDQSDALAIAIAHAQSSKRRALKKHDRATFWETHP